ncbi:glycosyltransferase family 2 protein [Cohnella sp. GCM10027633]|uniref:glycosyltransferase family 2 protein n=1 Tax=unclassified Cohnella TaxID=2636738 RepID=UPI003627791F
MGRKSGMTLAICTRDRHEDVLRCIGSIARQEIDYPLEVLIVDDGSMPEETIARCSSLLTHPLSELRYWKKRRPGLLLSRLDSLERAEHDIIVFLDDDTELTPGYLNRLSGLYASMPEAAGIGGRDASLVPSRLWNLYSRVILFSARSPGRLSLSGYGGAMTSWGSIGRPFPTQFLAGFNMSFRRSALAKLMPVPWLMGYSLGEDLYLSQVAGRTGTLWIDPLLQVMHHQSPLSRDKEQSVAYTEIANHYYLLRERGAKRWRYGCLMWTSIGLLCRSLLRSKHRTKATGYWRGIRFLTTRNRVGVANENIVGYGND